MQCKTDLIRFTKVNFVLVDFQPEGVCRSPLRSMRLVVPIMNTRNKINTGLHPTDFIVSYVKIESSSEYISHDKCI